MSLCARSIASERRQPEREPGDASVVLTEDDFIKL